VIRSQGGRANLGIAALGRVITRMGKRLTNLVVAIAHRHAGLVLDARPMHTANFDFERVAAAVAPRASDFADERNTQQG
jgi:hypothetical protein